MFAGVKDYSESAQRFRHQAEECRQLADLAHSDSVRQTLVNVAGSYDLWQMIWTDLQNAG
jgi:hypothetical protein